MKTNLTFDAAGWPNVLPVLEAVDCIPDENNAYIRTWLDRCFPGDTKAKKQFMKSAQNANHGNLISNQFSYDESKAIAARAWNAACLACGYTVDCEVEDLWG